MDETMAGPVETDPRLTERWQSLTGIPYLSQSTSLFDRGLVRHR
jgi:hypothetical protein